MYGFINFMHFFNCSSRNIVFYIESSKKFFINLGPRQLIWFQIWLKAWVDEWQRVKTQNYIAVIALIIG